MDITYLILLIVVCVIIAIVVIGKCALRYAERQYYINKAMRFQDVSVEERDPQQAGITSLQVIVNNIPANNIRHIPLTDRGEEEVLDTMMMPERMFSPNNEINIESVTTERVRLDNQSRGNTKRHSARFGRNSELTTEARDINKNGYEEIFTQGDSTECTKPKHEADDMKMGFENEALYSDGEEPKKKAFSYNELKLEEDLILNKQAQSVRHPKRVAISLSRDA